MNRRKFRAAESGFTITELIVGIALSLIAVLVIFQVLAKSEAQKRTTSMGVDADVNGAMAVASVNRQIQQAGFGMFDGYRKTFMCPSVNTYFDTTTSGTVSATALSPVAITNDETSNGNANDFLDVSFSTTQGNVLPVLLAQNMTSADTRIYLTTTSGIAAGDFIFVTVPRDVAGSATNYNCGRYRVTRVCPKATSSPTTGCAISSFPYLLHAHTASGVSPNSPYNPPAGTKELQLLPNGAYPTTSPAGYVVNMGGIANRRFRIMCNALVMQDLNSSAVPTCTAPNTFNNVDVIAPDVMTFHAQYGVSATSATTDSAVASWVNASGGTWAAPSATDRYRIVAVRFAFVVRSPNREKTQVSPATLTLWPSGPTYTVPDRNYRYKVFYTVSPLRNVIWAHT